MKEYKAQPLDLMQYINTKYHEPFIHEKIEFSSPLSAERLAAAIDRLIAVFPLLKCTYRFEDNTFYENDISAKTLLAVSDSGEKEKLLTESLDTGKQLIKFTLCGGGLFITASHLLTDGSGFKQLLYILCDLYNGKEGCGFLMNRDFSALFANVKKPSMLKMLVSVLKKYKNKPIYEKAGNERLYIVERELDKDIMERTHKKAKAQGATLNDVFMTAFACAISDLYGREKINIPCNVDLRKYAEGNTGVGNLTGTLDLNLKIKKGMSFAECLKDTSRLMNEQKKSGNDIAGPMLLVEKYKKSTLKKFLKTYGGLNTSPFVDYTNLGKLDETRLNFDGAEVVNAVGYSGVQKAPYFQIAISSFKGVTTISSIVFCGESECKKVSALMDAIRSEIENFGKSS